MDLDISDNSTDVSTTVLSYPFFWKPSKICQFLRQIYKLLQDGESNSSSKKEEILEFKEHLKLEACRECVFSSTDNNWRNVLGEKHFEILTTKYVKQKNVCKSYRYSVNETCICDLLLVIRHKHEHWDDFPSGNKLELGWFNSDGILDELEFVRYWITRFPKLVQFLWCKFEKYKDFLQEFYPYKVADSCSKQFLEYISQSLEKIVYTETVKGELKARFSMITKENESLDLEIFQLESEVVPLEGLSPTAISLTPNHLEFIWKDSGSSEYKSLVYKSFCDQFRKSQKDTTFLFVNTEFSTNLEKLLSEIVQTTRFLVFSAFINKTVIQTTVKVFDRSFGGNCIENPLKWQQLPALVRKSILNQGHIIIQGKSHKLENVLSEKEKEPEQMLFNLVGQQLNDFLKLRRIEVFSKQLLPITTKYYIKRRIVNRGIVGVSIFSNGSEPYVIMVTHISPNEFHKIVVIDKRRVLVVDKDTDYSKYNRITCMLCNVIICVNSDQKWTVVKKCKEIIRGRPFHILEYMGKQQFQWISVDPNGHLRYFDKWLAQAARKVKIYSEEEFLKCIENDKRIIFIADKPGMGKSQVLASLAQKIWTDYTNTFVVYINMNEFVEKHLHFSVDNNINVNIENYLIDWICTNEFEAFILKHILQANSAGLNVEIFFDGLDEVDYKFRSLAMKILKSFLESTPSVRQWVACRDHMLSDIHEHFECLGYCLEPFSEEDQIKFIVKHWLSYCETKAKRFDTPEIQDLIKFARNCTKVRVPTQDIELAGVPLQCRMIAEINEGKVFSGVYKSFITKHDYSLIELYKELVKRKLEVYLREKNNLPSLNMDHCIVQRELRHLERIHAYLSIKLLISEKTAEKIKNRLIITEDCALELKRVVEAQGIVQKLEPLTFIHRTFAEYMLVNFICKVVKGQYLAVMLKESIFQKFLWEEVFALKNVSPSRDRVILQIKHPTLWHFFDAYWGELGGESSLNLAKATFRTAKALDKAVLHDNFYKKHCPLFSAICGTNFVNLSEFFALYSEQIFPFFYLCLRCKGFTNCTIIVNNIPGFIPQCVKKIQNFSEEKYGILHWAVVALRLLSFPITEKFNLGQVNVVKYIPPVVRGNVFPVTLDHIKVFVLTVFSADGSLLKEKDGRGQTPLQLNRILYDPKMNNKHRLLFPAKYNKSAKMQRTRRRTV